MMWPAGRPTAADVDGGRRLPLGAPPV